MNERYKGCALLQKGYTEDCLTKKRVKNDGAVPQYYQDLFAENARVAQN